MSKRVKHSYPITVFHSVLVVSLKEGRTRRESSAARVHQHMVSQQLLIRRDAQTNLLPACLQVHTLPYPIYRGHRQVVG
jgi:hypothetical protein